jgi:hypothetical protein
LTLAIVSQNRTVSKLERDRERPESENPPHNNWGKGGGEEGQGKIEGGERGDRVESKRNDEPAADDFAIIIEREEILRGSNKSR